MSNGRPPDHTAALIQQYAQLLSLAAHEFRTPASVVGGYLRMLQRDDAPLTDRQRKMIDEAAKSCAQLVTLIGQLSEIGKLDSHSAPVTDERFDLFQMAADVAAQVRDGQDRDVRLQLGGLDTGARLAGDGPRLRTALGAIFRTVLREQAAAGIVRVHRCLERAGGTTAAVLVVAPDADVPRAYDAQASTFDEQRGGVGLSLPIARRVIERLGGRVWSPTPANAGDRGLKSAVVMSVPLPE